MLKLKTLLRCFLRSYCIGANFNTKGLQNIGLSFAMDPGLQSIYKDPEVLRQARRRYLGIYNCHPYWTPLLVGYFLFLEVKISKKVISEEALKNVKKTSTYTLSAIGDSFFSGSFLIFWSLALILLLQLKAHSLACLWLLFWGLFLQLFKFSIFWLGWTRGLTIFQQLKQLNLINWGQRLKYVNAALLLGIGLMLFPALHSPLALSLAAFCIGLGVWLVWKRWVIRDLLLFIYFVALVVFFQWV